MFLLTSRLNIIFGQILFIFRPKSESKPNKIPTQLLFLRKSIILDGGHKLTCDFGRKETCQKARWLYVNICMYQCIRIFLYKYYDLSPFGSNGFQYINNHFHNFDNSPATCPSWALMHVDSCFFKQYWLYILIKLL